MKERPEGLFGQNIATHTIRLETLSFCLQMLSLICSQWRRHSAFLSSFLPFFLFLSLPPSLISRPWVLEDLEINALMWVSKHGSWEVSHESGDGPRNTSANDILLHFSEESPTDHFKLGQAVPGKAFWIGKKVKIPDMLIKSDSPPLGIFGDMNTEWFGFLREKANRGEYLQHPRHWGQIWRWVTFVHLFNKYFLSSYYMSCMILV